MKLFTKLFLTFAMLCFAGVVSAQDWQELTATGWVHEWRTMDTQTDGPALTEDGAYKVYCRSAAQAAEAGNPTKTNSEPLAEDYSNFADWDSQFFITFGEANALKDGDKIKVSMKVKADVAATIGTQSHGAPGAYIHWACIGDVNFTTDWADFATGEIEVGNNVKAGTYTIAFNLAKKIENTFYFKDIKIEVLRAPEVANWTDLVVNGDMESANECFYVTEQGVGGPFLANLTAGIGKDGSKAVKVQSGNNPSQDWDSQFFIRLPYQLPAGTKYKVSFDYKANKEGGFDTQAHGEPGGYKFWAFIGSGNFTTDWQTFNAEGSVSSDANQAQTIAFNLAKNKVATEFIFDNVKFEVPADVATGLTANPAVSPAAYPASVESTLAFDSETRPTSNNGNEGDILGDSLYVAGCVNFTVTPNPTGTPNRYWSTNNGIQLRMYGGKIFIEAFEGRAITKVIVNNGKWNTGNTFNGVAAAKGEWEGNSTNVIFEVAANTQMNNIVVTTIEKNAETTTYAIPSIANTAETAYTVAEAIEKIEAGIALSDVVFVKGIISQVDSLVNGEMFYWISDDGTTTTQFQLYKGKNIGGAAFAALEDVELGAKVIATGLLAKYNDIYEMKAGNELVSYEAPAKALFADGKYYILNKGAEKYLAAGSNWGTHAVVDAAGLDYGIAFADGKYTLDSQVSNGGDSHFLNGEWNDGKAMGWNFAEVAEGVYTISDGTNFLTAGEDGRVTLAADGTVSTAQWTLVAAADRDAANIATLAAATAENGVDATFFVKGANFNRNDLRNKAWTATKSGGNQTIGGPSADRATYGCESWNNTFDINQTIENLPEGVYEFSIAGYGSNGTTKIYANDTEAAFVNTETAANFGAALDNIAAGQYTGNTTGKVMVIEGTALKIGVKRTEQVGADWTVFDNARLTYFGAIPADAFKPAYEEALAAAQAALANEDYAAVTGEEKTALEKAIADYAEIAEPTAELYKAAIAALTSATTAFTGAKAAYENFNLTAAGMANLAFPYAAASKAAAAQAAANARATSAADATAKTEALLKAYRQYAESSALLECQFGAAVNMTDSVIVNPNAQEDIAEPWAVVLGEGSGGSLGTLGNEPLTDGNGSSDYKYFDGGNWGGTAWDVALEQTITLPAGKYYLTAAGRAAENVTLTLFAGDKTAQIAAVGNQGALFGRGWSDASVEFEMAEAGDIKIGVRGVTDKQYQWMSFTRFRLMQFGVAGEDAPELQAPEGWNNEIANGNLAGDNVDSYASKEYPAPDPSASTIVAMAGKDFSRGILVKAQDKVSQPWDSQFWIVLNEELPAGATLHVEFDCKADKAGSVSTQSHAAPGGYLHWACIGNVNFTTEWQHFSAEVTVDAAANNMKSIAFNLNDIAEANNYYFDNFGVWAKIPEKPKEWINIVKNSDMEGTDNSCFYVTEQGVGGPFLANFTAGIGKNGSKAIKVQSADSPAQDWDTQFFVRMPYQLPSGTQYKVSFDYKADVAGDFDTQAHAEPGQYIYWAFIGSGSFTTDWQTYEAEGIISDSQAKNADGLILQSIAFNLAKNKVATEFIFDNFKFEIAKDVADGLTENPAVDPQPYPEPDGISTLKNQKNVEGMYNLNGQKVNKAQKGLYILNGKKMVVK